MVSSSHAPFTIVSNRQLDAMESVDGTGNEMSGRVGSTSKLMQGSNEAPNWSSESNAGPSSVATQRRAASNSSHRPAGRRAGPHLDPFGAPQGSESSSTTSTTSARLMRQRFRQRCQEAMARDRQRDRARRLDQARQGSSSAPSSDGMGDDEAAHTFLSSEQDHWSRDDTGPLWHDEEEEAFRKMMTAEYRMMLQQQRSGGATQEDWLDPDEVAWLEEEMRKEAQVEAAQQEPPPELLDEDEMLCDIFEDAQTQSQVVHGGVRPSLPFDEEDEDFSWVHDAWDENEHLSTGRGGEAMDTAM